MENTKLFFGFALADSMLANVSEIKRISLTAEEAKERIAQAQGLQAQGENVEFIPCLNPSHQATIAAMQQRFGIEVPIPATPPQVALEMGDHLIVMGVRGLPRLTDRHEYTAEEIEAATFAFTLYAITA